MLSEVSRSPDTTQRNLAGRLGISLGLTNLLLRNVARKGYVRVARTTWRRRLYALTPQGMVRRVRLTWAYVERVLGHYQNVKLILQEELESAALHAETRVALYGTAEFAELVYLGLKAFDIDEIEVFDGSNDADGRFLGMPVRDAAALEPASFDRVVVAELNGVDVICATLLSAGFAPDQIVTFFGGGPRDAQEPKAPASSPVGEGR